MFTWQHLFAPVFMNVLFVRLFAKIHSTKNALGYSKCVLLATALIYLRQMLNAFVRMCFTVFPRCDKNIYMMKMPLQRLRTLSSRLRFSVWRYGGETASWVDVKTSDMLTVNLLLGWVTEAHAHFIQSRINAIKVLKCLHIAIKIGVRHICYINYELHRIILIEWLRLHDVKCNRSLPKS